MKKIVNGELVDVSAEEQAEIEARWAYNAANPPVPQEVTRFQALAALHNANLLTAAETAINAAGTVAQLAWANALVFQRSSPLLNSMATALNLSSGDLDDLFRAAALIEA